MTPNPLPKGVGAISNTVVTRAIEALQANDSKRWFGLFSAGAEFSDDGLSRNLRDWCEEEFFGRFRAYLISIDKVENGGLTFFARYHSDKWGDFKTFWRFKVENGQITKLDVGATSY